jgi:heme exporter protein A
MAEQLLKVERLLLWRGERHVLRGVDFSLERGTCLEVTGPNGAGKTSLLRILCGLAYPEEGQVLWNGADVRRDLRSFQGQCGYLGHEPPLKMDLTARENLHFWVGTRRRVSAADISAALERVGGLNFCDRPVRTLSAGQRRRAALAALLLLSVPLWILDEPTTHLDTEGQALVGTVISEQLARGGMVVAAVHQDLSIPAATRRLLELAA